MPGDVTRLRTAALHLEDPLGWRCYPARGEGSSHTGCNTRVEDVTAW